MIGINTAQIDPIQLDSVRLDPIQRLNIAQNNVAQLAQDKGCTLQIQNAEIHNADDVPLYWVENVYFISRPFCRLVELKRFIQKLPVLQVSEPPSRG